MESGAGHSGTSSTLTVAPPTSSYSLTQAERDSALANMLQEFRVRRRRPFSTLIASVATSFESITGNRTRSLLTMLGIFIGVAAVVAALTLTQSVSAYFNTLIEGLGANTVLIQPGSSFNRGTVQKNGAQSLTVKDVKSIQKIYHVTAVSPLVQIRGQIVYGNQNWKTSVSGVSASLQTIQNWELKEGFWFTESEDTGAASVAVLGDTVVQNLFANSGVDPIGQKVVISNQVFRVIGVLSPKGGSFQDDVVYIPFNTAQNRFGFRGSTIQGIQLQVDKSENVNVTAQAVTNVLEQNHRIRPGKPDDFQMITSEQLLQQVQQETGMITVLLVGIAAISLTVGGIGIMNIMLVSVTQRRREIGLRMSIGARGSDILKQFLIESLVLCLIGGGLGLLGGLAAGYGMATAFGFPAIITALSLIMPFVVSTVIALTFGIYPAMRASRLDPVIALRSPR